MGSTGENTAVAGPRGRTGDICGHQAAATPSAVDTGRGEASEIALRAVVVAKGGGGGNGGGGGGGGSVAGGGKNVVLGADNEGTVKDVAWAGGGGVDA